MMTVSAVQPAKSPDSQALQLGENLRSPRKKDETSQAAVTLSSILRVPSMCFFCSFGDGFQIGLIDTSMCGEVAFLHGYPY